eukprot:TRINITY_DN11192_c0_g1_i10.p1 TRINITY_DN11192_c0_g1~~TRINITY_DN11192_c0_g1_i10.p1  ORF type:complete len:214 (+),score=29.63 TRINITY_DN11192_c0_g1_i10:632-1273(+)
MISNKDLAKIIRTKSTAHLYNTEKSCVAYRSRPKSRFVIDDEIKEELSSISNIKEDFYDENDEDIAFLNRVVDRGKIRQSGKILRRNKDSRLTQCLEATANRTSAEYGRTQLCKFRAHRFKPEPANPMKHPRLTHYHSKTKDKITQCDLTPKSHKESSFTSTESPTIAFKMSKKFTAINTTRPISAAINIKRRRLINNLTDYFHKCRRFEDEI